MRLVDATAAGNNAGQEPDLQTRASCKQPFLNAEESTSEKEYAVFTIEEHRPRIESGALDRAVSCLKFRRSVLTDQESRRSARSGSLDGHASRP